MRPRLWFDGEPDRFGKTLALMPKVLTATVRYAEPDKKKFRLTRWLTAWRKRRAA